MAKRSRRKQKAPSGSTREKGDIVEQIVATMHQSPGVKVERNVYLPTRDGSRRTREIDVLLTSHIAGYSIQVAIECKNEEKPIGVQRIDEFIGKLNDVGIPTQQGIYVSASRYTTGAIARAKKARIRSLILQELENDSLHNAIRDAFQSLIYLLLTITTIQMENDVPEIPTPHQMLMFYDGNGRICGSVPDIIWRKWLSSNIPDRLGTHELVLEIPDGWLQIVDEKMVKLNGIRAIVQVTAHVINIPGRVHQHKLVSASSKKLELSSLETVYERPSGTYGVNTFQTEKDLQKYIHGQEGITLSVGRFRLPRIRFGPMYWPPSNETARKIVGIMKAYAEGKIEDPRPLDLAEIEGTDLSAIWEPIWSEYKNSPFSK